MRGPALLLAVASALAWVGACTFPSVDYANTGGGGATGTGGGGAAGTGGNDAGTPTCEVAMKCAAEATSCGKKAEADAKSCEKKCKPPEEDSCKDACISARESVLAGCAATCVSCVALPSCPKIEKECTSLANP